MNSYRIGVLAIIMLLLTGCGHVDSVVLTKPTDMLALKSITIAPPEVKCETQNDDDIVMNRELQELAADELRALMNEKNIVETGDGKKLVGRGRCQPFLDVNVRFHI